MSDIPAACYLPTGETGRHGGELFESTRLAAAEWYPDGQHGGVVSALLSRAVERSPTLTPMEVARVTVELFRVVPVVPLEVVTEVIREGKRLQTTEVRLFADTTELARGLVQRLRTTNLALDDSIDRPDAKPDGPRGLASVPFSEIIPFPDQGLVTFGRAALEIREVAGSFTRPGPATAWFRFDAQLVEGECLSPTQRAVLAADFSNGLSRLADGGDWVFMNSDLSVHLARPPVGDWVALDGQSTWHRGGRGVATSHLFDEIGSIGRAAQTLFLDEGFSAG